MQSLADVTFRFTRIELIDLFVFKYRIDNFSIFSHYTQAPQNIDSVSYAQMYTNKTMLCALSFRKMKEIPKKRLFQSMRSCPHKNCSNRLPHENDHLSLSDEHETDAFKLKSITHRRYFN